MVKRAAKLNFIEQQQLLVHDKRHENILAPITNCPNQKVQDHSDSSEQVISLSHSAPKITVHKKSEKKSPHVSTYLILEYKCSNIIERRNVNSAIVEFKSILRLKGYFCQDNDQQKNYLS
jgi:hypothetical protein